MNRPHLKPLLLSSTLLGLAAASLTLVAPATAQEAAASKEDNSDVVVITGTRIAREGYVSSSPVTTLDAEELGLKQPVDVEEVLRSMPQFSPGNGGQVNNGSAGASTLDLRGLTTPRTLPLIDGKRMVGFDPNGLFDVTAVPLALLKRVDVVTGGASAVYGSDAVAGVVNFILDDEFKGAQFDANYGITDHGDGETENVQGTLGAGFDDGRGNVVLSLGYAEKEAVYQTRGPGSATPGNALPLFRRHRRAGSAGRRAVRRDGQSRAVLSGLRLQPAEPLPDAAEALERDGAGQVRHQRCSAGLFALHLFALDLRTAAGLVRHVRVRL